MEVEPAEPASSSAGRTTAGLAQVEKSAEDDKEDELESATHEDKEERETIEKRREE